MKTRWRFSRLYRWILRAFPSEFRGDFGDEMSQIFEEERAEASARGRMAVARLWGRTLAGIADVASREHVFALKRDAAYALRMMWHERLTTAAIIVTLAIGVGASTAMFAVVNAVMLELPLRDPERVVAILRQTPRGLSAGITPAQFEAWRRQEGAFDSIAALWGASPVLTGSGETRRITLECISPKMFRVLGVAPVAGRMFVEGDDAEGAPSLIVISDLLWTTAFSRDPAAIGRSLVLDGLSSTVIGIMPSIFDGARAREQKDGWITIADCTQRARREGRTMPFVNLYARLKPGATLAAGQAQLEAAVEALPDSQRLRVQLSPLTEQLLGDVREPLFALQGAAAFVLLIGCANIASLLLGRAETRRRELAMRFALGCTRARMVRQLLTESVVLALVGGAVGLFFAYGSLDWLRSMIPGSVPRISRIEIDRRVLAACLSISTGTGMLFGLLPAWYSSHILPGPTLKESRLASSPRRRRAGALLVVAEVALSVAVLAGAGLMLRTFLFLRPVDPGFDPRGKVTVTISLPRSRYPDAESWMRFFNTLNAKLAALPGVRAVAVTSYLPLSGFISTAEIETQEDRQASATLAVGAPAVSANYFSEMGIRLLRGRAPTDEDRAGSPDVAVVNEAFVQRVWPGADPLSRRIRVKILDRWSTKTIVGLVRDTRSMGSRLNGDPEIFVPFSQNPMSIQRFVISTSQPAERIAPQVKNQVMSIDPSLPPGDVQSVTLITTTRSVAQWRFAALLMGAFAFMALALAAVGLFAVVARSVTDRTPEIGIRMALGATRGEVLRLFVVRSFGLTVTGLVSGVALGAVTTRFLASWLVGVPPHDRLTYACSAAVMCAVCLTASYAAARRAMRVDPLTTLRGE